MVIDAVTWRPLENGESSLIGGKIGYGVRARQRR